MSSIKKIVAIGPESTGKSTLCEQLAAHYQTAWCAEYAREYLLTHGKEYGYDDLLVIANGQVRLEEESLTNYPEKVNHQQKEKPGLLFIDTDMYVMKVWCEFVFNKCHPYILDQLIKREYDLYLLCNTDLPWVRDELREYPDEETRKKLFLIYKDCMINQPVPWVEISGSYDERLKNAIAVVDRLASRK
jgi:NadR type nicotinamide-nucleotide adenylyltransferase